MRSTCRAVTAASSTSTGIKTSTGLPPSFTVTGVCHATSTYAFVEDEKGPIVKGKAFTGFPEFVDTIMSTAGLVQKEFLPIPFSNDQALEDAGADLKWRHKLLAALNPRYTRVDWPFVTGMGPKAARSVARAIIGSMNQ